MNGPSLGFWVGFNLFVLVMLALDLTVFHKAAKLMSFREAALWSLMWIALAAGFAVIVFFWLGRQPALQFVTGYVIEQSLSVDNLFIFLVLFSFFKVPAQHQYRVLFWGIIGAIVMRLVFILAGVAALRRFHQIIYLFGAFLIYTGIRLAIEGRKSEAAPKGNRILTLLEKFVPITAEYRGGSFFVREAGRTLATPLFAVLFVVEITDLLFAVDSIPAVLAISRDSFIVYTSNVFAILGLRAMFFALSGMVRAFHFLNYGLAAVLSFIGVKMLLSGESGHIGGFPLHYEIATWVTLTVIGGILSICVVASLLFPRESRHNPAS